MMARARIFAGERLRRLREQGRMSQAALARALSLSPSYLNQIENDRRPLPEAAIPTLAALFGVEPGYFADMEDRRRASDLREATGDPLFGGSAIAMSEAEAAVRGAPEAARRFLTLYRAYLALDEEHRALRARLAAGAEPEPASRFPYDEVRDWVQSRRNYFGVLDEAAETLSEKQGFGTTTFAEDLTRYLRDRHDITVTDVPGLRIGGTIWRLDRRARRLVLAEGASPESRRFWMAHVLGLIEQRETIARLVTGARLGTEAAAGLARVGLANYFAGALVLPYRRFLHAAQAVRHDIERLQGMFGASFEQICHRLSTMQRPTLPGIPFYFLKTDIAGNVLKRSSATRFQFARFGGPCPLWNVYQAFAQPGRILVQVVRTPDGTTYLSLARTVGTGGGSYLERPRAIAVGLGCEIGFADQTVYATGLDLDSPDGTVPIGPGCRACERPNCGHRAVPPVGRSLDIGTGERGVVPYRILQDESAD
ncbi:MAG TPA: short-chain fatty acyl-CoA regulator family protein [Acetobacteraceae bacterium]|nr:short-chain fatty acyl-CoA regulator family protein [Acetobacteraceae bacterium]